MTTTDPLVRLACLCLLTPIVVDTEARLVYHNGLSRDPISASLFVRMIGIDPVGEDMRRMGLAGSDPIIQVMALIGLVESDDNTDSTARIRHLKLLESSLLRTT